MEGATCKHAILQCACRCNACLKTAGLKGVYLIGADLRGADLDGADLDGADLDSAILQGAVYDARTIWPEGFDPGVAGAILASRSSTSKN